MAFTGTTLNVPSGADLEPFFAQMTNGASVQLLLARGGTWTGDYLYRQAGGSETAPHIIKAAPGTGALPLLTGTLQIGVEATPIDGLTIKQLMFTGKGPNVLGSGAHLKLNEVVVVGGTQGIVIQADGSLRWKTVTVNKCRVMDLSDTSGAHVQGIYCFAVDGLRIIDSVFDHAVAPKDTLCHHAYIQNGCTGVIVRRNIFSRSSSHALQLRPGGEASNNLVIDCPIGILGGGGTAPEAGGVTINIHDNATLGGGDIAPGIPRGWAYYLENIAAGSLHNNLAINGAGGDMRGLTKDCSVTGPGPPGDPDVTMVGVLGVNGANYHKNHPTVHTDAGPSTGTVVSWNGAPVTGTDTSFTGLGLTWDAIRAGTVSPSLVIQTLKELVGLSTPKTDWVYQQIRQATGAR